MDQARNFLTKRNGLRGKGGIDWVFPGPKEMKMGLDALKKKNLIKNWIINTKSASISLLIDGEGPTAKYYTIRNPSDVSGFLRSCNSKGEIIKIVDSKRFFFDKNGLIAYKNDQITEVYKKYGNDGR